MTPINPDELPPSKRAIDRAQALGLEFDDDITAGELRRLTLETEDKQLATDEQKCWARELGLDRLGLDDNTLNRIRKIEITKRINDEIDRLDKIVLREKRDILKVGTRIIHDGRPYRICSIKRSGDGCTGPYMVWIVALHEEVPRAVPISPYRLASVRKATRQEICNPMPLDATSIGNNAAVATNGQPGAGGQS